jgi:hypothetical protein
LNTRSFGRSQAKLVRTLLPGKTWPSPAARRSNFRDFSVSIMPMMLGYLLVSMVTMNVADPADVSPVAAWYPSVSAVVIPPAHSPSQLRLSLPVIFLATSAAFACAVR